MAGPTTPRRSARERKANKLYDDQVRWTEDLVRTLRAPSNSPDRSSESSAPESVQRELDIDFQEQHSPPIDKTDEHAELSDASEDSIATLDSERSNADVLQDVPTFQHVKKHGGRTKDWQKETGVRSRMLHEGSDKLRGTLKSSYFTNFGPDVDDLYPILQSRDVWRFQSRDAILPSRASLKQAVQYEAQGKYLTQQERNHVVQEGNELSQGALRQISIPIELQEAYAKRFVDNQVKNSAVLGPFDDSAQFGLSLLEPFTVSEAYTHSNAQRGSVINLGAAPMCMDWAWSLSDQQYLAIAFRSTKHQRGDLPSSTSSPAFTASAGYPAHVQILKVTSNSSASEEPARLSQEIGPCSHQQLCMSWGSVLSLKWLPPPTASSAHSLVVLTSDGNIRIVRVDLGVPKVLEIKKPELIAPTPSDAIFTCLCIPSATDLIAGDTMGRIHLFNLTSSQDGKLTPYMTINIHHTYIMSVAVANDYPHFLASQSAAGEVILTDLRAPTQDRVVVRKTRLPTRNLAYFPFTRTFVTTADLVGNSEPTGTTSSTIIGHNLRHFYQTSTLIKLPEASGVTTALATSPFHPIALVANAGGSVFASNLIRRMLPTTTAEKREKSLSWMMQLYEIQWREADKPQQSSGVVTMTVGSEEDGKPKEPIDLYHGPPTRNGVTRFHEGFKPERVDLGKRARSYSTFAATTQIILPEEQAVTTMCWNPNPRFSGWAAIAWGSGILAVRDLSHDVV